MTAITEKKYKVVVHATREAALKLGGIGAVLDGVLKDKAYNRDVARTFLVGQVDTTNAAEMGRLKHARDLEVIYSTLPGMRVDDAPGALSKALRRLESAYNTPLLYAKRRFGDYTHEVIAVDPADPDPDKSDAYKWELWDRWGIDSYRYQDNPEYDFYVKSAEPAYYALLAVLNTAGGLKQPALIFAHEFMGLPFVFSARLHHPDSWRAILWAHEMPDARMLVEGHNGHDTRFYNVLRRAEKEGKSLGDFFGDRSDFHKHALVARAAMRDRVTGVPCCEAIAAVGDTVVEEYRFLGGEFATIDIGLAYNGVPSDELPPEKKAVSKKRLQQYAENLWGFTPDYVFTHVTRCIISKGLWRDLRVLEHLDPLLAEAGKTAALFVLATAEPSGRDPELVRRWEKEYGWPIDHLADDKDLIGHEAAFYDAIRGRWSHGAPGSGGVRAVRVALINQFGWSRDRCGERMPEDMEFMDIRHGSDLEFGQSIYEPFGIAQLEPLSYGAICVISDACGSVGFVREAEKRSRLKNPPNVIVADYTTLPDHLSDVNPMGIGVEIRDEIESRRGREVAEAIMERLPVTDAQKKRALRCGHAIAKRMGWDVVVERYILPLMERVIGRQ